jgi:hypothetical protein
MPIMAIIVSAGFIIVAAAFCWCSIPLDQQSKADAAFYARLNARRAEREARRVAMRAGTVR